MYDSNSLNTPSNVLYDEETIPLFARWIGSWRISLQRRALSSAQLARFYDLAAPGWSRTLDRLGYGNGVFDLVMTAHVLEHFVDPSVALSEMVRVLKPGGLHIACLTRRSSLGMYVHLKWRTHRVTPAQAESWLLESGLENARCQSFDHHAFSRHLSVVCVGRKPPGEIPTGFRPTTSVK